MLRQFVIGLLLGVGLIGPSVAENLSSQDARKAGEAIVQAYNKAGRAKDAAALAKVYTEDAVLVMPSGPLVGRAAIEDYFKTGFKTFTLEGAQLERVTMIANGNVMLRVGSFTGTIQGSDGESHVKGYWASTDVRDGEEWKIRQEEDNMTILPSTTKK